MRHINNTSNKMVGRSSESGHEYNFQYEMVLVKPISAIGTISTVASVCMRIVTGIGCISLVKLKEKD